MAEMSIYPIAGTDEWVLVKTECGQCGKLHEFRAHADYIYVAMAGCLCDECAAKPLTVTLTMSWEKTQDAKN